MNKTLSLLKRSGVFYLATTEENQPKVRPFGSVAGINGKLYICTNNTKNCFRQILANPRIEISGMIGAEKWFRITGVLKVDSSYEVKKEFLRQSSLDIYKADDDFFEVLYFEKGKVDIFYFSGKRESYELYN